MPKKIFDIPGTNKKMHIEHNDHGHLIGVTDEQGTPAKTFKMDEVKIKFGEIEAQIIEMPEETTFVTRHNPTCRWVLIGGKWYYICG